MTSPESKFHKSIRYPLVILLLAFTALVTALISLFVARIWLFEPNVTPVVLNSQERSQLEEKLRILDSASSPEARISPEQYTEQPEDRVIYLAQRELNALIAHDGRLANKASVDLSKDKISAGLLVTLPEEMPIMPGKTVKVTAGLQVGYKDGRPSIVVEGVSLMGIPLPSNWLGGVKGKDLVKTNTSDGGIWKVFSEGIRDLSVEEGRMRIELKE